MDARAQGPGVSVGWEGAVTRARSLANVLAGLCRRIGQVSSQGVDLAVDLQPPPSFVFQVKNMDYYKREVSRG